jgi:cytochrome c
MTRIAIFALVIGLLPIGTMSAAMADVEAGERVFRRACAACHSVAQGGRQMMGANLHGVVGRPAGTVEGARYSAALRASGLVWDEETLRRFLAAPREVVPGTTMAFAGVRDPADKDHLLAFLRASSGN